MFGFCIWSILFALLTFVLILVLVVCAVLHWGGDPYAKITIHDKEKYFEDCKTKIQCPFPSLSDTPSVALSVIVPAYFEEQRLPPMLDECFEYLERRSRNEPKFSYEVIVVNDGSTDGTATVVMDYAEKYGSDKLRLLNLVKNRGKGGAVRIGVQSCRGSSVLFADADGATRFSDLDKLYSAMHQVVQKAHFEEPEWKLPLVVCGSRAHLEQESVAHRSFFRTILMHGFHFLVWLFTVRGVRDTQCGFKLFSRSAARILFPNLHIERWAFDVELLYIAQTLNIPIDEVAVYWTEIDGSKVTPVWSWLQMGMDLVLIWLRYRIGAWKLNTTKGD